MSRYEEDFWVPDGGMGMEASDATEQTVFDDGCDKVAEGVVWDYFAGSYRGVPEARFFEYATYIRLPAYDASVW